jgi:hypothetical protein
LHLQRIGRSPQVADRSIFPRRADSQLGTGLLADTPEVEAEVQLNDCAGLFCLCARLCSASPPGGPCSGYAGYFQVRMSILIEPSMLSTENRP